MYLMAISLISKTYTCLIVMVNISIRQYSILRNIQIYKKYAEF